MKKRPLLERAANPKQYDLPDLEWSPEVGLESPFRSFFWQPFLKHSDEWKNASLLDIGAGTGWLVHEVKKYGAKKAVGIEPSEKNRQLASQNFPDVELVDATLENFETDERFDGMFSVMSFPHIADITSAFERIADRLKEDRKLYLLVPDYDYYKRPRHDYAMEIEEHSPDEFVVAVKRPTGILADIVRKNDVYIDTAKRAGLVLETQQAVTPTEELMERQPKYRAFEGVPIVQFLVFKKEQP